MADITWIKWTGSEKKESTASYWCCRSSHQRYKCTFMHIRFQHLMVRLLPLKTSMLPLKCQGYGHVSYTCAKPELYGQCDKNCHNRDECEKNANAPNVVAINLLIPSTAPNTRKRKLFYPSSLKTRNVFSNVRKLYKGTKPTRNEKLLLL